MLVIRCKNCNKELVSHPSHTKCCGCPNMTTVCGEKISALDLSDVIVVNSVHTKSKSSVLTTEDIAWQEARRQRKVKRLDFEVR